MTIRAGKKLEASHALMCLTNSQTTSGYWQGVQKRYLGLKFYIEGKAHYGWARLTFPGLCESGGTLTGYAYETIANKSIVTGKTKGKDVITVEAASLGHLAQGTSGLSAWRRTNSVAASH